MSNKNKRAAYVAAIGIPILSAGAALGSGQLSAAPTENTEAASALPSLGYGDQPQTPVPASLSGNVPVRLPAVISSAVSITSSGAVSAEEDDRFDGAMAAIAAQEELTGIDPMRGWSEDDLDAYAAYWDAGYSYQQLLALATEWNLSEFEAKALAGEAILAGDTSSIDAVTDGIEPFDFEVESE